MQRRAQVWTRERKKEKRTINPSIERYPSRLACRFRFGRTCACQHNNHKMINEFNEHSQRNTYAKHR
ncbi:hypothetical protein Taro_014988 [Colocasia esculenta]|uniref:Uncharacterized protein n=1 Tax=Colocasia esculenta TaxID=4460 RepID=A0A843UNJ9_COLES|nr:hypothetical protein [Colocasia esculenta]